MNAASTPRAINRHFSYQPCEGLMFGGYDMIYAADANIRSLQHPGLFIGLMLCGQSTSVHSGGSNRIPIPVGRPIVLSFAKPTLCTNTYYAGEFCAGVGLHIDFLALPAELGRPLKTSLLYLKAHFMDKSSLTVLPVLPALNALVEQALQIPQDAPFRELELEAVFMNFMAYICRATEQLRQQDGVRGSLQQRARNRVKLVTDYLQDNLDQTPSLTELSEIAGVNPSTLSDNFKTAYGRTIFAFFRDLRLDAARRMLRSEGLSVTETGLRVGFSSPAAFATAYRRRFGHSPSQEIEDKPDFDKRKPNHTKAALEATR
ncbi:helix-turn-helix domain-containing protein [Marinobacter xestospongiae]|uniref:helix-turn-helix domain-containing protein n=1 Tax=Marinobacter xestospongiae TaxID=994319 RepID=UPI002006733B|nr:AraC family transcriptional regulator [Marinobacter xestospongiae]MCK7565679.1 AraC family transcriptional regulator [Marinobacter xestospongiae]